MALCKAPRKDVSLCVKSLALTERSAVLSEQLWSAAGGIQMAYIRVLTCYLKHTDTMVLRLFACLVDKTDLTHFPSLPLASSADCCG